MSDNEAFTLVSTSSQHKVYDDYERHFEGVGLEINKVMQAGLRRQYPELALAVTLTNNVPLLQFAAAGNAVADLDIKDESIERMRYFYRGNSRRGIPNQLAEARTFAKYYFRWGTEYFIVYIVQIFYQTYQYILKEPKDGETTFSKNSATDHLIFTVGQWSTPDDRFIYVYDQYWTRNRLLYAEVQKANWDDVILNEGMKKTLTDLMHKFFDSEDIYKDLGVPWKRGVIFHGPAGNGKTISIKALMHSLFKKNGFDTPSLYVKSAPRTYDIRSILQEARYEAPCLLIFEDIDAIVTPSSRSYFFNEVDGLENNDGLFMVASTNHLDQLDPGLSSRPSRFDRKYLFPLPSTEERILYCNYWREKLKSKPAVKFPKKLCIAIAGITQEFSFAYLKEAFVATLIVIAGHRSEDEIRGGGDDEGGDIDDYELWREIKKQVKLLREDMGGQNLASESINDVAFEEDVSWKEWDPSQAKFTTASRTTPARSSADEASELDLPIRVRDQCAGPKHYNSRLGGAIVDRDSNHAPLMTDSGMLIDSRFDGPRITESF